MSDNRQVIEEKLRGLQAHYRRQLAERLLTLAPLLACAGEWTAPEREALMTHSHQLAGTAATYGFAQISETARALYTRLQEHSAQAPSFFQPWAQALLAACQEVAAQGQENMPSEEDAVAVSPELPLVLVVDDDPIMHLTFRKLLQRDARVQAVSTIVQALSFMRQEPPKLVLVDHLLGEGVSGIELLQAMRRDPALTGIATAMVSADVGPELAQHAHAAGARCYLHKPISPARDLAVLRHLLQ